MDWARWGHPKWVRGQKGTKIMGLYQSLWRVNKVGGYVGCEDGSRCRVEGFDSLAVVTRTYDDSGGSELLDIQPLAVLEE